MPNRSNYSRYSKIKTASPESTQEWFEAFAKTEPYQHRPVDLTLLSPQELKVLELLSSGNSRKKAAKQMLSIKGECLSHNTAGDHEGAVHRKLHVKNRAELVKAALAAGVIKPIEGPQLTDLIQKYSTLTEREHEVFEKIATGKTVAEMSKALGITENTVCDHKKRLYSKLGITNFADATRCYVSLKLEADRLIAAKQATLEMEKPAVVETPQPSPEATDLLAPTSVVHSVSRDLPELSPVALAAAKGAQYPLRIGASYNKQELEVAGRRTCGAGALTTLGLVTR